MRSFKEAISSDSGPGPKARLDIFDESDSEIILAISRDLRGDSQENETKWIVAMTTNSGEKRLKLKE
jgi:hypothetical protein